MLDLSGRLRHLRSRRRLRGNAFAPERRTSGSDQDGTCFRDPGVSATAGRLTWEGRFPTDFDIADLCAALN